MPLFKKHKNPSQSHLPIVDGSRPQSAREQPVFPPAYSASHRVDTAVVSATTRSDNLNESTKPRYHHPRHPHEQTASRTATAPVDPQAFDADRRLYLSPVPNPDAVPRSSYMVDQEKPPKSKKSLFNRHSTKDSLGFLDRRVSVKGKKSGRHQQQRLSLQVPHDSGSNSQNASPRSHVPVKTEHGVDKDHTTEPYPASHTRQASATPASSSFEHPFSSPNRSLESYTIRRSKTESSIPDPSDTREQDIGLHGGQNSPFPPSQPPPLDASFRHTPESSHAIQDQAYLRRIYLQSDQEQSTLPASQQSLAQPSPLRAPYLRPGSRPSVDHSQPVQLQGNMNSTDRPAGVKPPHAESGSQQGQSRDNKGSSHLPYPHGSSFKNNASQQSLHESPRNTPTPLQGRGRDEGEIEVPALLQKYEELQAKYSKVKRYYFEKEAQVQKLQNTIAYQRMASSHTILDDNEYINRFNRLDGAIKDLAFSIRKDWKSVPTWLQGNVNSDAHTVGTKEMMAVGRAVVSRWLVEEIFHRHFHPALDQNLSMRLKDIEMNLRCQPTNTSTDEDKENAVARISNWRRTTFDGLGDALRDQEAGENRSRLTSDLVSKLVENLGSNLRETTPKELENAALIIVENTVNLCEKIPLESRDIRVEYFLPGVPVVESLMKVETGLPPLASLDQSSNQTRMSTDQERSLGSRGDGPNGEADIDQDKTSITSTRSSPGNNTGFVASHKKEPRKKSIIGSLINRKNPSGTTHVPQSPDLASRRASVATTETKGPEDAEKRDSPPPAPRIRFACFPSVVVRGKGPVNALIKAPVYLVG